MSKIVKMKYGNEENTTIVATLDDDTQLFIPVPCYTYHQEWVNKALNEDDIVIEPYKTTDELKAEVILELRSKRDLLLTETDWLVLRHLRQKALEITTSLTEEQYIQLEEYRNDLGNLPEQKGFPEDITWPVKPDFVTAL